MLRGISPTLERALDKLRFDLWSLPVSLLAFLPGLSGLIGQLIFWQVTQ
jgi:hypothetical protein